ncbi:ATP-grasp fold amidoligase family protein [Xenorhabdus sp. KK7.4]|uniref:ATP-grasp fold amidoligase family protein n=1 Tax=Xenorhabdus sp. KK7.4 TaxID=1851572 RepID=UPI000C051CA5|nr:ATP-grasp fold amidoligase family protein [Xenorhabdus sp. KK7.4]PHM58631.1 hypothetical protein Xekk_01206 [Xenorhabdus sp. KK7.4]
MSLSKWIKRISNIYKFYFVSDENYRRDLFRKKFKKDMNLDNPQTFNEKINYRILKDKNPLYTKLADKLQVREYVKKTIGEEYLIKLLGCYKNTNDIKYKSLPDRFVLKCNHDAGSVIICKEKKSFNYKKANKKLNFHLKNDMYKRTREWHYKNIQPQIICEEYLDIFGNSDDAFLPEDYKLHCFGGKVEFFEVQFNRFGKERFINIYDRDWKLQPFTMGYKNASFSLDKPSKLSELIYLAEMLSRELDYCRVDFYIVNDVIYFGEITFTPCNGLDVITPEIWDYKLGQKWNLILKND